MHGLYENAIYGGRVDDAHDIQILRSYVTASFGRQVSRGGGKLGPFELPADAEAASYHRLVQAMPEEDKPATFGLPANIERSHQRNSSAATIAQLRTLQRSLSGAAKFEREKWQKELTPILNLWKRLNQGSNLLQAKLQQESSSSSSKAEDPIKAFVQLENHNATALIQHVHKSLSGLSKVQLTDFI